MTRQRLAEWLGRLETFHPKEIELGLDRVKAVAEAIRWSGSRPPIVIVGGTNGKGTCVALIEALLQAAGYRVGAYTSPHLVDFNERIRVGGVEATDEQIVAALERVEACRGGVSLTYFEFATLGAIEIFQGSSCDVWVMEVGLGGRLDAVNILDADVALISSVSLDHEEWLGHDREAIALEKAGIFRPDKPAVVGARPLPRSLAAHARQIGAPLLHLGTDFDWKRTTKGWDWHGVETCLSDLPGMPIPGNAALGNAACSLAVLEQLRERFSVSAARVSRTLESIRIPGRFQVEPGGVEWILDVAHNPEAARELARNLADRPCDGRTFAVLGMLCDKDVRGVTDPFASLVDVWITTTLAERRGFDARALAHQLQTTVPVERSRSIGEAFETATRFARAGDRVLVFGSFRTVGAVLEHLRLYCAPRGLSYG